MGGSFAPKSGVNMCILGASVVTLQQTEPWEGGYLHFLQRFADFGAAIMVPMDMETKNIS
jgi:hypothetical protein